MDGVDQEEAILRNKISQLQEFLDVIDKSGTSSIGFIMLDIFQELVDDCILSLIFDFHRTVLHMFISIMWVIVIRS